MSKKTGADGAEDEKAKKPADTPPPKAPERVTGEVVPRDAVEVKENNEPITYDEFRSLTFQTMEDGQKVAMALWGRVGLLVRRAHTSGGREWIERISKELADANLGSWSVSKLYRALRVRSTLTDEQWGVIEKMLIPQNTVMVLCSNKISDEIRETKMQELSSGKITPEVFKQQIGAAAAGGGGGGVGGGSSGSKSSGAPAEQVKDVKPEKRFQGLARYLADIELKVDGLSEEVAVVVKGSDPVRIKSLREILVESEDVFESARISIDKHITKAKAAIDKFLNDLRVSEDRLKKREAAADKDAAKKEPKPAPKKK